MALLPEYKGVKRILDFIFAGLLLLLLTPVFVLIAAAVYVDLGKPIFFVQERPGLHEKPFLLLKFRTMRSWEGSSAVSDFERMSRLGRSLRRMSLDELPGLWNVVRGDMSLVGPRPLLVEYLPIYSTEHRRRHEVRPGLTGLAQALGRNSLAWKEKLDFDVEYVESKGPLLDLQIIFKTLYVVFSGLGVNASQGETMPRLALGYDTK